MRLKAWRGPVLAIAALLFVTVGGLVVGGWCYADQLKDGVLEPARDPQTFDLQVIGQTGGHIALRPLRGADKHGDWTKSGVYGLEWNAGYAQVGRILELDGQHVMREFVPVYGAPEVGELVRLDSFAWPGDSQLAFGIPFEEVKFSSPLGDFPAWFVRGSRDTWVIFVHGRGADRREALRMLPTVIDMEFPSLIITYRNDPGTPPSPDGFYLFGQTEWEDLEGAARYAVRHGAGELIIVGYSMGGAIAASFLYNSALADLVQGVILDAPMLNFRDTIDRLAWKRGAPWVLTQVAERLAEARFDVDWGAMNYLKRADELAAPILLFQGDVDDTVPAETSAALARARPELVTYVPVRGAGHVRSWNIDPEAYASAVREFLERVTQ